MKKMYLFLILSLGVGSLFAQQEVKTEKKEDSKAKITKESKTPQSAITQGTIIQGAVVSKNENGSTETVQYNKVDGKTVISKEDFNKQSDRGKEHILANPELYKVEE